MTSIRSVLCPRSPLLTVLISKHLAMVDDTGVYDHLPAFEDRGPAEQRPYVVAEVLLEHRRNVSALDPFDLLEGGVSVDLKPVTAEKQGTSFTRTDPR